jgi:hypothetical protein
MPSVNTISVLERRLEFLEGLMEIATSCNWSSDQISELHDYVLEEIINIDNLMLDTCEATHDPELAQLVWEGHMEDLRHWLSLVLGIRIKFV